MTTDRDWWEELVAGTRTREDRQLDLLRDWLVQPIWDAYDAVWLLAGLVPDGPEGNGTLGNPGYRGFVFLPGGLRDCWRLGDGSIDAFTLEQDVEMERTHLRKFIEGDARSPTEWIEHARAKSYDPPWSAIAEQDEDCRLFLPKRLLPYTPEIHATDSRKDVLTHSAVARKGAATRWSKNEQWNLIERIGRPLFNATVPAHPTNTRWGQGELVETILKAMEGTDGKDYTDAKSAVRRHIVRWLAELRPKE